MDLLEFQNYLSINVGKKTTLNYINQMKGFFLHYELMNQENLNAYLSSKIEKWSGGSFNMFFKAAKWYFKFTKTEFELPEFKKVEAKPRAYLDDKEIQVIIEKCPAIFTEYRKVQCLIQLLSLSGMRPKELLMLKRENVNITERKIVLTNTKTFKSRTVFLTDSLSKDIDGFFQSEAEDSNAFNLSETSLIYYCKKIKECLNINVNPYIFRHSLAHSFLKKSGNDLVGLAKTLGHSNLNTTRIYSEASDEERQAQFNRMFNKKGNK